MANLIFDLSEHIRILNRFFEPFADKSKVKSEQNNGIMYSWEPGDDTIDVAFATHDSIQVQFTLDVITMISRQGEDYLGQTVLGVTDAIIDKRKERQSKGEVNIVLPTSKEVAKHGGNLH